MIPYSRARKYYLKKTSGVTAEDAFENFNPEEVKSFRKTKNIALTLSMMLGTIIVTCCILIPRIFPVLNTEYDVQLIWGAVKLPLLYYLLLLILLLIEIISLHLLNIWAITKISSINGYPDKSHPDYERHVELMIGRGLEKKVKDFSEIKLNPFARKTRAYVFFISTFIVFKAVLSNYILKFLIRRLGGRYIARNYIDYFGIPVYAFWNAWATHRVIRHARFQILSTNYITKFNDNFSVRYSQDQENFLKQSLQIITQLKNQRNDYYLWFASDLVEKLNIEFKEEVKIRKSDYLKQYNQLSFEQQKTYYALLFSGFVLDGKLSKKEIKFLDQLSENAPQTFPSPSHLDQLYHQGKFNQLMSMLY